MIEAELTYLVVFAHGTVVSCLGKYGSSSGQSRNIAAGEPAEQGTSANTNAPVDFTRAGIRKHSKLLLFVTLMGW